MPIPEPCTRTQLVGVLQHLALRRPRRALLEEAEVELWRMYRCEQADLLLEAARLRARATDATPESRAALSAQRSDIRAQRSSVCTKRSDLNAWRRQAAECAAACAWDGYPIATCLADCLARPLPHWTSARDLADEARRLGATGGEA